MHDGSGGVISCVHAFWLISSSIRYMYHAHPINYTCAMGNYSRVALIWGKDSVQEEIWYTCTNASHIGVVASWARSCSNFILYMYTCVYNVMVSVIHNYNGVYLYCSSIMIANYFVPSQFAIAAYHLDTMRFFTPCPMKEWWCLVGWSGWHAV